MQLKVRFLNVTLRIIFHLISDVSDSGERKSTWECTRPSLMSASRTVAEVNIRVRTFARGMEDWMRCVTPMEDTSMIAISPFSDPTTHYTWSIEGTFTSVSVGFNVMVVIGQSNRWSEFSNVICLLIHKWKNRINYLELEPSSCSNRKQYRVPSSPPVKMVLSSFLTTRTFYSQ